MIHFVSLVPRLRLELPDGRIMERESGEDEKARLNIRIVTGKKVGRGRSIFNLLLGVGKFVLQSKGGEATPRRMDINLIHRTHPISIYKLSLIASIVGTSVVITSCV